VNRIATALLWASLALAAVPPSTAKGKVDAWVLKQHSCNMGNFIVTAAPDALRIDALAQDYTLLSRAPDWTVFHFNSRLKKFCRAEYKTFIKSGNQPSNTLGADSEIFLNERWGDIKPQISIFRNLKVNSYTCKITGPGRQHERHDTPLKEMVIPTLFCQMFTRVDSGWNNCKRDAILKTVYLTPPVSGIPIALLLHRVDGTIVAWLNTLKANRLSVDSSTFDLPKNLKETSDLSSVLMDWQRNSDVKEMLKFQ